MPIDAAVLTKKIGPLPVWAYGAGLGGIALFLASRKKSTVAGGDYAMQVPTTGVGSITADNGAGDGGTVPNLPPVYVPPDIVPKPWFTPPIFQPPVHDDATVIPSTVAVPNTTTIPSIISTAIAPSPAAGAAAGTSTKTFAASIADFAKSIATPLAVVGNYFTADPTTKPTWVDPAASNSVTVPGIPGMTQAPTLADIWAKSQALIAASPALQQQIATANVQESQRQYAIVGEGGTLLFMDPSFVKPFIPPVFQPPVRDTTITKPFVPPVFQPPISTTAPMYTMGQQYYINKLGLAGAKSAGYI